MTRNDSGATIEAVLERHPSADRDTLIPILQDVQEVEGYLSKTSVLEIGKHLDLPASKIYGVATFYNQFRFEPLGRFHIQVCRGTACHVSGSAAVMAALQQELGIKPGETSRDRLFSLEVVACIGACGLAPVISVNGNFHANLTKNDIPGIVAEYRQQANKGENDG